MFNTGQMMRSNDEGKVLPSDLTGVEAWYDCADLSTLVVDGSGGVDTWLDKSGNGYSLEAGGTKPTLNIFGMNGMPSVDFTTSALSTATGLSQLQDFTIFCVDKSIGNTGSKALFFIDQEIWFRVQSTQTLSCYIHNGTSYGAPAETTAIVPANNPSIYTTSFDSSDITVQVNDGAVISAARAVTVNSTSTSLVVGNTGGSTDLHSMSELIVFNRKLTDAEIETVKQYLSTKWNIDRDPITTSAPTVWLDATDSDTLTLDGTDVDDWADKSGNGNDAIPNSGTATYNSTGMGGFPSVEFSSSNLKITDAASLDYSEMALIVVSKRLSDTGGVANNIVQKGSTGGDWEFILRYHDNLTPDVVRFFPSNNNTSFSTISTTHTPAGNPEIINVDHNGTDFAIRVNNTSYGYGVDTIANAGGNIFIGGSAASGNAISELVFVPRALPAEEFRNIIEHLSFKYDILITAAKVAPVFIQTGQSNSVGNGVTANFPDAVVKSAITDFETWVPGSAAFATLEAGVNQQGATSLHSGPEGYFGYHATQHETGTSYHIKDSNGGARLHNSNLGNSYYPTTGTRWTELLVEVNAGMKKLRADGVIASIQGILWIQGEDDSNDEDRANAYEVNQQSFLDTLRSVVYDTGYGVERVKFVMNSTHILLETHEWHAIVTTAKIAVAADNFNTEFLDGSNYELSGDDIHFNHNGQKSLGEDLASKFWGITGL